MKSKLQMQYSKRNLNMKQSQQQEKTYHFLVRIIPNLLTMSRLNLTFLSRAAGPENQYQLK